MATTPNRQIRMLVALLAACGLAACAPTTKAPNVNQAAVQKEKRIQQQLGSGKTQMAAGAEKPGEAGRRERQSEVPRAASGAAAGTESASGTPPAAASRLSLHGAAFKLWRAAAEMCAPKLRPGHGIVAATLKDIKASRQGEYARSWALDRRPRVALIAKGSPAERAGLQPGDLILAINGARVAPGGSGRKKIDSLMRGAGLKPVKISINREIGEEQGARTVELTPVPVCDYTVHLLSEEKINAYADGNRVIVTSGMMDFVRTATELETVLAHELAHNLMKHRQAKEGNVAIGTVIGLVLDVAIMASTGVNTDGAFTKNLGELGSFAYSQGFEAEADYVGLYVMARAGSDYHAAPLFWRRMSVKEGQRFQLWSSHPSYAERFVAMTAATREIDAKIAAGKPLIPEKRKRATPGGNAGAPPIRQANGDVVE